jgi:hypothetical protein
LATVEEIVRDIESFAPANISGLAIARWIDNRYKEMVSKIRYRHLRKVGELSIPGVFETGSVTATRGSTAVSGSSTQFETDMGSGDQEHYYLSAVTAWYQIASVTDESNLVLNAAFSEDSVSSTSYTIVKRTHALDASARWLGTFVMPRLRRKLNLISHQELNISVPGRPVAGRYPESAAQVGVDSNGYIKVEIYPPPKYSELINYVYWDLPSQLTMSSTIPQVIDNYVLKEGALVDVYRASKIAQINLGNVEAAAVYSNEEAKQRTIWNRSIKDAQRTQQGSEDLNFVIEGFGGQRPSSEIRTAREHVLSRWSY